MKNIFCLLFTGLLIFGMVCPALALPISIGDVLYDQVGPSETVLAFFIQPDGGISIGAYSGFVEVTVSGYGWSMGSTLNDAFYLFTGPGSPAHNAQHHQLVFDTQTLLPNNPLRDAKNFIVYDIDTSTEVTAPYVPAYRPDHIYNFVINTGTIVPKNLHFGVSDGDFYDNGGSYSIEISQLQPVSVPEPSLMVLLGITAMSLVGLRRCWKE